MTLEDDLAFLQRYESEATPTTFLEYARRQLVDPNMPTRPYAGLGKYRYNESGLCYMPGHKPRESTRAIRLAAIGLGPARNHWWWQAQFRLYGVPFKPGDDCQDAAIQALDQGMFIEPPSKLKAIEHRLAIQFGEVRQQHVEKLKDYYMKKTAARQLPSKRKNSVEWSPAAKRRSGKHAEIDLIDLEA